MRTLRTKQFESAEPVGIVIADGGHGNVSSRLAAFVWGPVPDDAMDAFNANTSRGASSVAASDAIESDALVFASIA